MNINNQRVGQFIFNFLEWLYVKKGIPNNQSSRMADPFHLLNEEWYAYIDEYQKEIADTSVTLSD